MQELGIVNIRDLTKTFDGREVISHCDMTVKQGPVFYEHLSAEENLNIHLSYMGSSHADSKAALRKVGLDKCFEYDCTQYFSRCDVFKVFVKGLLG